MTRRPPVALRYRHLLTPEWLQRRYVEQGLNVREVAAEAGVCEQTIYRALRRAGIELRPRNRYGVPYSLESVLTSEYLQREYVDAGAPALTSPPSSAARSAPSPGGSTATASRSAVCDQRRAARRRR